MTADPDAHGFTTADLDRATAQLGDDEAHEQLDAATEVQAAAQAYVYDPTSNPGRRATRDGTLRTAYARMQEITGGTAVDKPQ